MRSRGGSAARAAAAAAVVPPRHPACGGRRCAAHSRPLRRDGGEYFNDAGGVLFCVASWGAANDTLKNSS